MLRAVEGKVHDKSDIEASIELYFQKIETLWKKNVSLQHQVCLLYQFKLISSQKIVTKIQEIYQI